MMDVDIGGFGGYGGGGSRSNPDPYVLGSQAATPTKRTAESKLTEKISEAMSRHGFDPIHLAHLLSLEPHYVQVNLAGMIRHLLTLWRIAFNEGAIPPSHPLYEAYREAALMLDVAEGNF